MSASSPPSPGDALSATAIAAGLGLLGGLALPLTWGLLPAALVVAVGIGLVRRRGRSTPGPAALATLPRARRWALAALLLAPLIPLVTIAARTIAAIVVAVPAALWAAVPALLAALVLPRPSRSPGTWSKGPVLVALVLGTAAAGAWGARFEAGHPHARGETFGGPILGIHPFQSTAVAIDGHGPFDLPINDFVEPDGSKGYGPEELAAALERDLHAIAEQQFAAHGPARAYRAFAGAEVRAVRLPGVRERLDREPEDPIEPRLHVISGGAGRRSRVEFVCPGTHVDPRPRRPDTVMERMCPDKYAPEASAGLGLTGRWSGYTELRGQARASLGRALGWPLREELRLVGLLVIAAALALAGVPSPRPAEAVARWGGAALVAAAVLALLFIAPGFKAQVGAIERAAGWAPPLAVAPWIALLALGSGHAALAGRGAAGWPRLLPVLAASLGLAGSLAAGSWLTPDLAPRGEEGLDADSLLLPAERLIAGLGEALHKGAGIGLDTAEAIVGATAVAALLGLLAGILGPGVRAAGIALAPARPLAGARGALAAVLAPAAGLVLSLKTAGGAALLAPAAATMWLAGAVLGGPGRLRIVDLLLSAAIVAAAGVQALSVRSNPAMWLALGIFAAVALAGLAHVRSPSDPPGGGSRP